MFRRYKGERTRSVPCASAGAVDKFDTESAGAWQARERAFDLLSARSGELQRQWQRGWQRTSAFAYASEQSGVAGRLSNNFAQILEQFETNERHRRIVHGHVGVVVEQR